jgi:cell wall-associated NlpC family hydrolase
VRFYAGSQAQPELTGVWGWTTGSQTYLRVRPGAQTPAVAKVPRGSKLFVWGKYNGWYRVETTDNKFGWVYHSYINAPQRRKLAELSHEKARLASKRSNDQTMYGSPELLRSYYSRYGASGALKGLEQQGVRVARSAPSRSPKVQTASYKRKPMPAVSMVRTSTSSTTRQHSVRVSGPTFSGVSNVRLSPSRPAGRNNDSTHRKLGAVAPNDDARLNTNVASSNSADAGASRASVEHASIEEKRKAEATRKAQAAQKAQAERLAAEKIKADNARRLAESRAEEARRQAEAQRLAQTKRAAEAQLAAEQQRLAEAKRAAEAQRVADAQRAAAQAKYLADAQKAAQAKRAAEAERVAQAQAAYEARRKAAALRASREAAAREARRQRLAQQAAARAARRQHLAQQKAQQRDRLRASMGAATLEPPMALPGLQPLTPEELLRAREDYMSSRHKTRPLTPQQPATLQPSSITGSSSDASTSPLMPSSYTEIPKWTPYMMVSAYRKPLSPRTQPLNVPQDASETPASKTTMPSVTFADRILFARSTSVQGKTAKSQVTTRGAAKPVTAKAQPKASVAKTAAAKQNAARAARLAPRTGSRGGSPRDYVRYAMNNGSAQDTFGQVMANQALSYRGAPYIRGATSPSRGFDCSGLVYYLLRQRGYNPPRTAAGLARYGNPVPRGAMQAGDIVLFANTYKRGVSHVGIYMGEGKFVHAARSGVGVRVDSLSSRYYGGKFWGARRVK